MWEFFLGKRKDCLLFLRGLLQLIRETVLLQDPGTRLALTHLIQDSISVVFDENYTVHPLPLEEVKRFVSKNYPALVSYLFKDLGIEDIPPNFPKLQTLIQQKDFIKTLVAIRKEIEQRSLDFSKDYLYFKDYFLSFLETEQSINAKKVIDFLSLFHITSLELNFMKSIVGIPLRSKTADP